MLRRIKRLPFFDSSADFANRIQVIAQDTGEVLRTFHNKHKDELSHRYGIGKNTYIPSKDRCLILRSHHQLHGRWRENRSQHSCHVARFEDSDDDDFNDATLKVEGYRFGDCKSKETIPQT